MRPGAARSGNGPLRPFIVSPLAAVPRRKRGARGRRRGGQLRSAKFLFTPLATPSSSRAVVCRDRCSRAARRSGGLPKKRSGGAGKADEGVAGGVNKNLAERSRLPPRRLCLNGLETQRRTADVPRGGTGPTVVVSLQFMVDATRDGAIEMSAPYRFQAIPPGPVLVHPAAAPAMLPSGVKVSRLTLNPAPQRAARRLAA